MDPIIDDMQRQVKALVEKRDEAQEALHTISAKIATLEKFIQEYQRSALAVRAKRTEGQADLFRSTGGTNSKAARSQYVSEMMGAAKDLIRTAGRPLTRTQLLDALEARGFLIEGGDKPKVLGTNLWRSGQFVSLKSFGYWPVEDPVPERFAHAERRPGAAS